MGSLSHALKGQALAPESANQKVDGYRGIWFELGQKSEHGDKYSGGLGTYTANHLPMAVYAEQVNKTYFVYGGTTKPDAKHLLCMIGVFDHVTGEVSRPVIVQDKDGVDDPHDNPSLNIDSQGYIYVFVSGRGTGRPGFKYRSTQPYSIDAFERLQQKEMTYPQIHMLPDGKIVHLYTRYSAGRELYWETSTDGTDWSPERKMAGFGGHYQVSSHRAGKIGTSFMYHPGGDVDRRTNLYYLQTSDAGDTWTTAAGKPLTLPLAAIDNDALVIDYAAQKLNVYIHDLNFDAAGRPAILYVTSPGARPGPQNAPHTWRITRWTGDAWQTTDLAVSDHCYDTGSIYIDGDTWTIIGPTEVGPQKWGTGGEVALWRSKDAGAAWQRERLVTQNSERNHSYVRRPLSAKDPFYAYWADGHAHEFSRSYLYFADPQGNAWQLPYDMEGETAKPVKLK